MNILVFDNYDSFTYNLVHYLQNIIGRDVDVFRNDEITLEEINKYDKILISPGPGLPEESGLLLPLLESYAPTKSILGVCLGLQGIAQSFGGKLLNLSQVYHGVSTKIIQTGAPDPLFDGLPQSFAGGRYHSWVVDNATLPACLEITAVDENGQIMGLRHNDYDVRGVQFHPESVLTEHGMHMIENWVKLGAEIRKS